MHVNDDGRREPWPGATELLTYEAAALIAGAWLPGGPASFTGSLKIIR